MISIHTHPEVNFDGSDVRFSALGFLVLATATFFDNLIQNSKIHVASD